MERDQTLSLAELFTSLPSEYYVPLAPYLQNDLEMPFQFSTRGTFKKRAIFNTLSRVGPGGSEAFIYSQAGLKKAA